jgi:hypothetical protein
MRIITFFLFFLAFCAAAQEVMVEPGKKFAPETHRTFRFGKSEIVTHKEDKKISDNALDKIIREIIEKEFSLKGISRDDAAGTLVVTYMAGSFHHSTIQQLGPLGTAPGQQGANITRDFDQGSLVIDVNEASGGALLWRVNSTMNTNIPDPRNAVSQVVARGFKKFGVPPKKKRKS